jgi:hypothetical protein
MPFGISIIAKPALVWLCIGIFPAVAHEDETVFSQLNAEKPRMRTGADSVFLTNELRSSAPLARLAEGQGPRSFTFGFVEFDWDPRNLASLPGFERWSVHSISRVPSK